MFKKSVGWSEVVNSICNGSWLRRERRRVRGNLSLSEPLRSSDHPSQSPALHQDRHHHLQSRTVSAARLKQDGNTIVTSYKMKIVSLSIDYHCHGNVRYFVSAHIHSIVKFLFGHYQELQRKNRSVSAKSINRMFYLGENTEILLFRTKPS